MRAGWRMVILRQSRAAFVILCTLSCPGWASAMADRRSWSSVSSWEEKYHLWPYRLSLAMLSKISGDFVWAATLSTHLPNFSRFLEHSLGFGIVSCNVACLCVKSRLEASPDWSLLNTIFACLLPTYMYISLALFWDWAELRNGASLVPRPPSRVWEWD